jgi:hypothetical protein
MPAAQKIISAALLVMLASCATTGATQQKYETSKAAISGSPKIKQRQIDKCVARVTLQSTTKRQNLADLANTSIEKVPQVYCTRIWNALADGRVSYNDYLASSNHRNTPNMIRVIQGR